MTTTRQCQGCKSIFPYQPELDYYQKAGVARYGVASPECFAAMSEIFAREIELYGYPPAHRLVVDAYAAQHPRDAQVQQELGIEKRLISASIQSIVLHLIALYYALEKKEDLLKIPKVMDHVLTSMAKEKKEFTELLPVPTDLGAIKINDVKKAFFAKQNSLEEYHALALDWARTAWQAWSDHHKAIRALCNKYNK